MGGGCIDFGSNLFPFYHFTLETLYISIRARANRLCAQGIREIAKAQVKSCFSIFITIYRSPSINSSRHRSCIIYRPTRDPFASAITPRRRHPPNCRFETISARLRILVLNPNANPISRGDLPHGEIANGVDRPASLKPH